MDEHHRGVVVCPVSEHHDELWLLETVSELVALPGVNRIDVDRTSTRAGEYLELAIEFTSSDAWRRFAGSDGPCHLLSTLEFELDRPDS